MNHAITIGGMLLSIGLFGGLLTMAFGVLSAFGNMMADTAGDGGKGGCIALSIGAVLVVGCGIGLLA